MPRALLSCFTIVAAFQIHLAAAALVEDAPVPPSVAALAARFDLDPVRDRSRFIAELTRALYSTGDARPPQATTLLQTAPVSTTPPRVAVPLPASVWNTAVFLRTVPTDQLVAAILSDRRASLLCRGMAGLDDETLEYFVEHPALVRLLYERGAGLFAAFGHALTIRQGRVVAPGGEAFDPLWEQALLASPAQPDAFIRTLFTVFDGRAAYLLETLDAAPPAAVQFALGAWLPEAARVPRFKSLIAAVTASYREWHPADYPFIRPLGDLGMMLLRLRLEPDASLAAPSSRTIWQGVLGSDGGELLSGDRIDAAWLVWATGAGDMYTRMNRLDQIAFGQRVFAHADVSVSTAMEIAGAFRRYKMLLLTLERMGVTDLSVYGAAVARAAALGEQSDARRFWTVAQFQGALAFLATMRRNGTIDREQGQALVQSLVAVPLRADGYDGRLARWWLDDMAPLLDATGSWEARAIAALAGPPPAQETRLEWEGQLYRVDVPFSERQRLAAVRDKQGGPTLDIALTLDELSTALRADGLTIDGVRAVEQALGGLAQEAPGSLRHPQVILMPPGVRVPRDGLEWITDAARRLSRLRSANDLRRAAAIGQSLRSLADILLGHVLLSFAYAVDIGDPGGAALLAGNVAVRHDFGFGRNDSEGRLRQMWAQPRQEFQPGVAWHVAGAALGLDIGLAPLVLQRASMDRWADAPKLSSIEREGLAVGVVLLDPSRLTDHDREQISTAIARGRARVAAAKTPPAAARLADELGLDGYRRRALMNVAGRTAAMLDELTAGDLLALGGNAPGADLDAWGTAAFYSFGCACTSYVPSRVWHILEGRAQLPMMAATMGDLNLTMAVMLRDLGVPVALYKNVLAVGLQDVIDRLGARGDWRGFIQAARTLRRQRVEDFVSTAAVVDGPLVPIEEAASTREH